MKHMLRALWLSLAVAVLATPVQARKIELFELPYVEQTLAAHEGNAVTLAAFAGHGSAAPAPPVSQITCDPTTGTATGAPGPCTSPLALCDGTTNDAAAMASFRAWALANQSTKQVKMTGPSGVNCNLSPNFVQATFFTGIRNLLVDWPGGTWTNVAGTQPWLFGSAGGGASGQSGGVWYDNRHSFRLETATAGDSCVTIKTQPQTNVTGAGPIVASASLTGSIVANGSFGKLIATAVTGTLARGQAIQGFGNDYGVDKTAVGTLIESQLSGTTGGIGEYALSAGMVIPSQGLSATGYIRLTVASTSGYADGDTVFVKNIVATGSGLTNAANGMWRAKIPDGTHIDLFQSIYNGDTYISGGTVGGDRTNEFSVGDLMMIGGWVHQTYWSNPYGDPPNLQWFEWKTVVSKNSGTQQVCFDTPLTHTYKSTWPQYNSGDLFHSDPGGAATMYLVNPDWDTVQEYKGLTLVQPNNQIIANGRTIKFTDITTADASCAIPSQNETMTWTNFQGPNCVLEFDKLVGTFNVTGSSLYKLHIQSSSMDLLRITNTTVGQQIAGTPTSFIGSGLTINGNGIPSNQPGFSVGAAAYGATTGAVSCTNCVIANNVANGTYSQPNPLWVYNSDGTIVFPNWLSASSGQYEIQTRGLVPGANFVLGGGGPSGITAGHGVGQVTDVTMDLQYTTVYTSFTSGFPALPSAGNTGTFPYPAPSLTFVNSSGNPAALSFSGCPAGLPMLSCQTVTYTGGASGSTPQATFALIGKFSSLTATPTTVYTGAGNLSWFLSQFDNWPMIKVSNGIEKNFGGAYGGGPTVNMKQSGTRVLTQTAVTCNGSPGACSGDGLIPPAEELFIDGTSNVGPGFTADTPAATPVLQMQMLSNPGVVYPSPYP